MVQKSRAPSPASADRHRTSVNNRIAHLTLHNTLLLLSALSGAIIAIGQRPTWQDPVEVGQVLAGIVTYPHDNPVLIYSTKVWSLLNQVAALILFAGGSESTANFFIEGIVGATSFAGIFLIVQATGNKPFVALLTPLLMHSLSLVGASGAYPIALLGSPSSYGIIGLSYILLVIGLLGTGRHRTGAFLAGMAPAVHPGLGTFCVGLATVSVLATLRELRPYLPRLVTFLAIGGIVTAASLAWQINLAGHVPALEQNTKLLYLDAYIKNFDFHRTAGGWLQPGVLFGIMLSAVTLICLRKKELQTGSKIVFSSVVASVAATFTLVAASDWILSLSFIKVLIPWRFMNYANICILPIAFGILSAEHPETSRHRSVLFSALLLCCLSIRLLNLPVVNILYFCTLLVLIGLMLVNAPASSAVRIQMVRRSQGVLVAALLALFTIRQVIPGAVTLIAGKVSLYDRNNTQLYRITSERPGILLTAGSLHLMQLATRRPVLLDGGALDMFSYIPETGPEFNKILKQIYGLDLFTKPADGTLDEGRLSYAHQALWESRSLEEWKFLQKEFGITDILTPASWNLKLPMITNELKLKLYTIPDCKSSISEN